MFETESDRTQSLNSEEDEFQDNQTTRIRKGAFRNSFIGGEDEYDQVVVNKESDGRLTFRPIM
jgi:hypothetical protein